MTAKDFTNLIEDILEEHLAEEADEERARIRSFAQAGLLTGDEGLEIKLGEKTFQLTIVEA